MSTLRSFSVARLVLTTAGAVSALIVVMADWIGIDPTPGMGPARTLEFCISLWMLVTGLAMYVPAFQRDILRTYGRPMLTSFQAGMVVFSRILLTFGSVGFLLVSVFGNAIGVRISTEWGLTRFLEIVASSVVCLLCLTVYNRPLFQWLASRRQLRSLSIAHRRMAILCLGLLVLPGLVSTVLVATADYLQIDPTPGWGVPRRLQLFAGLSMAVLSFMMFSRRLLVWESRKFGPRLLNPTQILLLFFVRTTLAVLGGSFLILAVSWSSLGLPHHSLFAADRGVSFWTGLLLASVTYLFCTRSFGTWFSSLRFQKSR